MAQAPWNPDPAEFQKAWDTAESIEDLAYRLHTTRNTLCRYARLTGLDLTPKRCTTPRSVRRSVSPVNHATNGITDEELADLCESRGIEVMRSAVREDREHTLSVDAFDGSGSFKIGIVSDTHLGSRYQQLTFLRAAYDEFARQGITDVLHAGDLVAGSVHMHPGMVYQQFVHGADQQAEYVCEHYPQRDGITTHGIAGNHDSSHMKAGGVNVLRSISRDRPDIDYLGMSGAYMTINGVRIYIHHPSGGLSYARSYKLQRQIEQFSPENKPNVLVCGHLHVTSVLESYRNVYAFIAGCFEAQTPYLVEKGVYPEVGFSTLEVNYDDHGAVRFRKEWVPLYIPISDDY